MSRTEGASLSHFLRASLNDTMLERIYNPITAMGFLAMVTFKLDNTKR